jgi:hypothetical protein
MSVKSAVITRRSSLGASTSATAGVGAAAPAGAPHCPQNLDPGTFSAAHDAHVQGVSAGVPHCPQKRVPSGFSALQDEQTQVSTTVSKSRETCD